MFKINSIISRIPIINLVVIFVISYLIFNRFQGRKSILVTAIDIFRTKIQTEIYMCVYFV